MRLTYKIMWIAVLLTIVGCGSDPEEMALAPIKLSTDYLLTLDQELKGNNKFSLTIENITPIECITSITADWGLTDTESSLSISYNEDAGCGEAYDFASTTIDFPFDDTKIIMVYNEDKISTAKFRMSEDKVMLDFQSIDGIALEYDHILRIPENMAWGFVLGNVADIVESFGEKLGAPDYSDINDTLMEGNYGHFVIGDLGELTVINGETAFDQSFALPLVLDQSWEYLTNFLETIKNENPSIKYYLANADGEEVSSD